MKGNLIVRGILCNASKRWLYFTSKGVITKRIEQAERLTPATAEKRMKELQEKFPTCTLSIFSVATEQDADAEESVPVPSRSRSVSPAETKA